MRTRIGELPVWEVGGAHGVGHRVEPWGQRGVPDAVFHRRHTSGFELLRRCDDGRTTKRRRFRPDVLDACCSFRSFRVACRGWSNRDRPLVLFKLRARHGE